MLHVIGQLCSEQTCKRVRYLGELCNIYIYIYVYEVYCILRIYLFMYIYPDLTNYLRRVILTSCTPNNVPPGGCAIIFAPF